MRFIVVKINIEIIYALPDRHFLLYVKLKNEISIEEAIIKSGILSICDDIDLNKNKVGFYGKLAKLSDILSEGDRIEIYRSLLYNPKEIRRKRAEKFKKNLNKLLINR
ncbi:MAG: RnfH family protein [Arsenophonus sp. ER-NS5-MAG3]